jgi:hypothetical protein
MKKSAVALAALIAVMAPAASAQNFSVAARAGSLGLGGEVSVGLGRMIAVRGGIGVVPYEFNSDVEDIDYTVSFPDRIWNVGVDLYPFGGGFRISGGLINRPGFDVEATGQQSANIGGRTYNGNVNLFATLENEKETAPYATIGFGRATGRGLGFFIDAGAAFVGDAKFAFDRTRSTCTETTTGQPCPEFQSRLQTEEANVNAEIEEFSQFVKLHPILNIGIRFGL